MSIEDAIARLTVAIEANTAALKATGDAPASSATTQDNKVNGPGYWASKDGSMCGEYLNSKEFDAVQAQFDTPLRRVNKAEYLKLKKQIDAEESEKAAEKKPASEKKAPAGKKAASEKKAADYPSEDALIAKAKEYLPQDLDKEERARRHAKVKPYLDEQGVKRATELAEDQRQAFIDFIDSLLAEVAGEGAADEDDDLL